MLPLRQALNTEDWPDGEPTDSEKDFWEIAAMEAYNQLTEWKSLQYCSTVSIDENTPPNLERMWSEPLYQVPAFERLHCPAHLLYLLLLFKLCFG